MAESRPREFLVKKRKGRTSKLSNINHDDNLAENSDTSDAPNTGDVSSVVQAASSRFKALSSRLQRVQTEYVRYSADSAVVPVQATTAFESLYANAALLHTAASEAGRRLQVSSTTCLNVRWNVSNRSSVNCVRVRRTSARSSEACS